METRINKWRAAAIGLLVLVGIALAYLALLNGRYVYIGEDGIAHQVFDKWRCKVIDVEYIMDE